MDFDFDIPQSDTEFEPFSPEIFEFPQLDAEFPPFESDIPSGAVTPPFSILSESGVSTPSEAETIRHEIPLSTNCNTPSMAAPAGCGHEDEVQTQFPHEDAKPLKVDTNSCLAGHSYETSEGRYIAFYWQSELRSSTPGCIYLSTFAATNLSWTLLHEPYLVASTARQGTPLAVVDWSNGLKGAVYFLDQRNLLCERVTQDGGKTWDDGMLTKQCLAARANSDIAADVIWEEMDKLQISVYFQGGGRNGIRQLKSSGHFPETKWIEDTGNNYNTLKALSGTSIICGHDFFCCDKQWIYTQSQAKQVQKHRFKNGTWESNSTNYFTGSFDRKVRLGYCADSRLRRLYLHDGSQVTERTRPRHHAGEWNAQTLLPSGTGIPRIGQNFVVLQWPQDVDDTASQIHLFSLLDGKLQDYIVGLANGASYSLVE